MIDASVLVVGAGAIGGVTAAKIAGGVSPTQILVFVRDKWENLDTQEAPRW